MCCGESGRECTHQARVNKGLRLDVILLRPQRVDGHWRFERRGELVLSRIVLRCAVEDEVSGLLTTGGRIGCKLR